MYYVVRTVVYVRPDSQFTLSGVRVGLRKPGGLVEQYVVSG